jgi:hypothetical protein
LPSYWLYPLHLQAATADELYAKGFKEYQSNHYVTAIEYLAAYKYHPDSKNADAAKMKFVDDAIRFSETNLMKCTTSAENSSGGGSSFRGKAVLEPVRE